MYVCERVWESGAMSRAERGGGGGDAAVQGSPLCECVSLSTQYTRLLTPARLPAGCIVPHRQALKRTVSLFPEGRVGSWHTRTLTLIHKQQPAPATLPLPPSLPPSLLLPLSFLRSLFSCWAL